jgi:hypothetical protein
MYPLLSLKVHCLQYCEICEQLVNNNAEINNLGMVVMLLKNATQTWSRVLSQI